MNVLACTTDILTQLVFEGIIFAAKKEIIQDKLYKYGEKLVSWMSADQLY